MRLDAAALHDLVARILAHGGMSAENAAIVAGVVVAAEQDGTASHGLFRLPGYLATLRSGWVDGVAVPTVTQVAPTLLLADGGNGFAQVALAAARDRLSTIARAQGMAALCTRNAHHFAALWPDVEPFAEAGFVALTGLNTRSHIVVFGGRRKILGTNPMAFACPRGDAPPLVWDQASSVRSQGEVLRARRAGRAVPPGVGVDLGGGVDGGPGRHPGRRRAVAVRRPQGRRDCADDRGAGRGADRRAVRVRGRVERVSWRADLQCRAVLAADRSGADRGCRFWPACRGAGGCVARGRVGTAAGRCAARQASRREGRD